MTRSWNKIVASLAAGLMLVGCSRLLSQHRPEPGNPLDNAAASREPAPLQPGVSHVTVGKVSTAGATIWWKSPWQGQTSIIYGRDPHLLPVVVERTAPTAEHTASIADLAPGTRYYFQVETATPLGVARSAVVSFRTNDAPEAASGEVKTQTASR